MELRDATDIAKQLAFEMNITFGGYLVEAVETWLQGVKEEPELLLRANGVFGFDLDWHLLQAPGRSTSSKEQSLAKLEPEDRPTRVRGPIMESSDREQRLPQGDCEWPQGLAS